MKKWILIGIPLSITLIVFGVLLSGYLTGFAVDSPSSFQTDGDKLVKYLGSDERVIIPENIKVIEQCAFENNDTIKYVVFPEKLNEIGYNAFSGCVNLEKIIIPDSVQKIDTSAFAKCISLNDVYLGLGLSEIGNGVFSGCVKLEEVDVHDKNPNYCCVDGVLYNKDQTKIYQLLNGRGKNFYIMPDTVTEIAPYAFWGTDDLNYITLSSAVEEIGPYAFANSSGLYNLTCKFGVKNLDIKCFEDCGNLEQIYLPGSIEKIASSAFDGCSKLSVFTETGSYAEKLCNDLSIETIYSPKIALDIANNKKQEYLDKIAKEREEEKKETLVEEMPVLSELFSGDSDVLGKTYVVGNTAVVLLNPKIGVSSGSNVVINDRLNKIENGEITEKLFYKEKNLEEIVLPDTVTSIGKLSFARSSLKKINIPNGVSRIEYGAFYHCDDLSQVSIPSTVTYIGEKAFDHTAWYDEWLEHGDDDYLIVGDGVLIGYKGKREAYSKPDSVKAVCCEVPQ